jgi:hypothetical protein
VLHRLPGRLRVHIPFLRRLPVRHQGLADGVASLLAAPEEIESVKVSLPTGNVLMRFDPSRVTEEDMLAYLQGMFEVLIRNRKRFEGLSPERLPEILEGLEGKMGSVVGPRLRVNREAILEDDVLA